MKNRSHTPSHSLKGTMRPPVFVLGNPRSGTTLLRLMLNNHRNIVVPPECGFAVWFYEKYRDVAIDGPIIENFVADLAHARKIETWKLDFNKLREYLRETEPASYPELVSSVYEFYGHSTGKKFLRWGDKNNFHLQHIDVIKKIFPSSRFVHIVRDGRDIACSYKELNRSNIQSEYAPQLPDGITEIALEWVANLQRAVDSFEKIEWQNVCEIRYEDLTSQPLRELQRVCAFLGEPYDNGMELYYLKNQTEQQEPVEFLQWKAKTIERPTTSQVGRYMVELTEDETKEFERIASPILHRYNYIT